MNLEVRGGRDHSHFRAGPAGLAAAITAARAGRPVVVHEQRASVGGRGRLLFAGEAAGFQDALWGFGMRYAMVSGHLAARALTDGRPEDYDRLWTARLGGLLRTGMVNRYLYEKLGDRGYLAFTRRVDRAFDARALLRWHYGASLLKRMLVPVANRAAQTRRKESLLCVMEGCDCTWCRCQHRAESHRGPDHRPAHAA